MDRQAYIQKQLDELFLLWFRRTLLVGISLFILFSILDYVYTPVNFQLFFLYRIIISSLLFAIYLIFWKIENIRVNYALAYLAVFSSAVILELMVLDTGGFNTPYYAAFFILAFCVFGFVTARYSFYVVSAVGVYLIYLVPTLSATGISDVNDYRFFFTHNFFLIAGLGTLLLARFLNHKRLLNELGLQYDLEKNRADLEQQVGERTTALADTVKTLEQEIIERQHFETQLRKASCDWRSTFDATTDIMMMLDSRFTIIKANHAATLFFSRSFPEILGRHVVDVFIASGMPLEKSVFETMGESLKHNYAEVHIPDMDIWLSFSADPILGDKGMLSGVVLIIRDITEIKQMQEKVFEAKDEWENTFNTINDAITVHDTDFNIILANKAAYDMVGNSHHDIIGEKCFRLFHGTEVPHEDCPGYIACKTGKDSTIIFYEPHLGRHLEINVLPRYDKHRKINGLIHVVKDITQQKKIEDMFRSTYEMNHYILEKAPFGIYVVNREGLIEYANPAILEISGTPREHFVGINVFNLPTYIEHGISEKIKSALTGTPFFLGPVEYTSYLGKKKTIRNFYGVPLLEYKNMKVLMFVEDVTDRITAEEARQKLQQQLLQAQKIESIGRLSGGLAHDFNNMLSVILGFSDLALMRLPEDHPVRDHISDIHIAGEKAAALTRQLLTFSRKQILEMSAVNLNALIDTMAKLLKRVIREDVVIEFKTHTAIRTINADPGQIEQVLMNLVVNARDAMPQGGRLTIETADVEFDAAYAETLQDITPGKYVMLAVSDTGVGMSRDVQDKIFEPFFTTKEIGKGTGLGLATTYGIVKQHHGHILVYSEPSVGATFRIYFPAVETAVKDTEKTARPSIARGTETILVVDDEPGVRKLIVSTLSPLGYHVLDASSGEDALEISSKFEGKIDLLLSDVVMPGINGRFLAEKISSQRPGIKTIFISGYADSTISHDGLLDPGVVLIQKPVSPQMLANKLREVFDGRQ